MAGESLSSGRIWATSFRTSRVPLPQFAFEDLAFDLQLERQSTLGDWAKPWPPAALDSTSHVPMSIAVDKTASFAEWLWLALPNWWLVGRVSRVV